ncbi:FAD/NAD(P)-binding domain-containing protein [Rickenella mellea]|uniref:FAD/NAD(P)-binding domain-containing protein n=1 Tax=Rickenella mellea TaxID=50990 RepID=A0A4Y7QMM0_9AGAM|nr:FAD/NAD(P)-binding domain-containing protein [Rickenella mellea]
MRNSLILCAIASAAHAFKIPFLDFLSFGSSHAVSSDVVPRKIAIIGAGAAGSSAAFWISKAKTASGVVVDVDVYEREGYIGGRSTVVYPYNDTTLPPLELGASIFVQANKNLWRAASEFNLVKNNLTEDDESEVGFWDGEKFVFTMGPSKGMFNWWNSIKVAWRYGISSPKKTQDIVKGMIKDILTIYSPESPRWRNVTQLVYELGWTDFLTQTTSEYLDLKGIQRRFSREVVEAATRVNYGQNVDEIHALEGACSLAANGASNIKGGNFQIFENFLRRSGATFRANTLVKVISQLDNGKWTVRTSSGDVEVYDDVIIAAPFHSTGIKLMPYSAAAPIAVIPPQPYVHLHVTLLTTPTPRPNPDYFSLPPNSAIPRTVLTTNEGVRSGGQEPEFNSLSYHGSMIDGRDEYIVKIFSKHNISDEWLEKVYGKVGWVYRKEWDAYPKLPPTTKFPPVHLAPGLYYVNAFEPFISTMETETVASRNVVDMLFQDHFGTGICGKPRNVENNSHPEYTEQTVFRQPQQARSDDDFVLGFDC